MPQLYLGRISAIARLYLSHSSAGAAGREGRRRLCVRWPRTRARKGEMWPRSIAEMWLRVVRDSAATRVEPREGLAQASRAEGMASLWRGLLPRLVTKSTGSLVWYTTYMEARRAFNAARRTSADG